MEEPLLPTPFRCRPDTCECRFNKYFAGSFVHHHYTVSVDIPPHELVHPHVHVFHEIDEEFHPVLTEIRQRVHCMIVCNGGWRNRHRLWVWNNYPVYMDRYFISLSFHNDAEYFHTHFDHYQQRIKLNHGLHSVYSNVTEVLNVHHHYSHMID